MNDIEKILEQYGADRRQQQQASQQMRHLARKSARVRVGLACASLVLLTFAGLFLWLGNDSDATLVAENRTAQPSDIQHTISHPQFNDNHQPNIPAKHHPHDLSKPQADYPSIQQPSNPTDQQPVTSPIVEQSEPDIVLETVEEPYDKDTVATEEPFNILLADLPDMTNSIVLDHSLSQTTADNEERLHFTASVGASAVSSLNIKFAGFSEINPIYPISPNSSEYTSVAIDPSASFSANAGIAYTIIRFKRSHFDIGLTASGYSQHGNVVVQSATPAGGRRGSDNFVITEERDAFNIFSLYAGLPLTFNMRPSGNNKTSCFLNLTPAHRIVSTRMTAAGLGHSGLSLNPWKLTLGVGLKFPRRLIGSASLTMNLLSLYTSQSIHEFGIEIGF